MSEFHRSKADSACVNDRILNDPSGLLNGGTFYSEPSEDISPRGGFRDTSLTDRQDQGYLGSNALGLSPAALSASPHMKAKQNGSNADIAPWMSEGPPELNAHGFNQNMFGEGPRKPSSNRPGTGRSTTTDSSDPLYRGDERNHSTNSATTVSSGNSWSKANRRDTGAHKKTAPFIGDNGQMSSKSSEASLHNRLQRESTNLSQQSTMSNRQDTSGMHSPTSSRPRTPLEIPSSDVTPWLFQDFQVRNAKLSSMYILIVSILCVNFLVLLVRLAARCRDLTTYLEHVPADTSLSIKIEVNHRAVC